MYWEELMVVCMVTFIIVFASVCILWAIVVFYVCLNGDLVERRLKIRESIKEPVFEYDEENPNLIHFYPKGK